MTEPSLALQEAIMAALKGDATVASYLNGRIYDRAPAEAQRVQATGAAFPLVTWGEDQVLDDSTGCADEAEVIVTLHIWSRHPGRAEAKRIAHAVREVLHDAELALAGNAMILIEHDSTRIGPDPDGLTWHGVAVFRSLIQAA